MITYNTLNNIIEHYEELLETAKRYGYTELRFFSSGNEEEGVLSILAKYTKAEPQFLFEDINEALAKILDTNVYLIAEGCREADSAFLRQEAEKAPLSDMEKTINYFLDSIIPIAIGKEPDEKQRTDLLKKWETTRDNTRRSTKHPRDVDPAINSSPSKKQTPPRSPQSSPRRPNSPYSFLGDREKNTDPLPPMSSSASSALSPRAIELCHALSEELGIDQEQIEKVIEEIKKPSLGPRHSGITAGGQ
jgi:hypothetical protein